MYYITNTGYIFKPLDIFEIEHIHYNTHKNYDLPDQSKQIIRKKIRKMTNPIPETSNNHESNPPCPVVLSSYFGK